MDLITFPVNPPRDSNVQLPFVQCFILELGQKLGVANISQIYICILCLFSISFQLEIFRSGGIVLKFLIYIVTFRVIFRPFPRLFNYSTYSSSRNSQPFDFNLKPHKNCLKDMSIRVLCPYNIIRSTHKQPLTT